MHLKSSDQMQGVIAEFNTSKDQNSLAFWICF